MISRQPTDAMTFKGKVGSRITGYRAERRNIQVDKRWYQRTGGTISLERGYFSESLYASKINEDRLGDSNV